MRIATWNVNSVNARLDTVLRWFEEAKPDVACLQEIKCVDEKFPAEPFERLGYNVAVHGQKSYNGVALLSKTTQWPSLLMLGFRASALAAPETSAISPVCMSLR